MFTVKKNRKILPTKDGFTLVEVMLVLVIVGLLGAMVGPSMYGYIQSNRLKTGTDRMVVDLQYTRSQAISRGSILRVSTTASTYTITDPSDGTVLRQRDLEQGVALAGVQMANFYPWGMADPCDFDMSNKTGANTISLLPTGIVEVQ